MYNKRHGGQAMSEFSREMLRAYLDDALSDSETARIERALRDSEKVRDELCSVRAELDRGDHSLGAIWRRERISCLSREDLNGHLHGIHDAELQAYVEFHLKTIACATCLANLEDLREKQVDAGPPARRRRKIFDSSSGLLTDAVDKKKK
jgi:hypothetical protein